MSDSLKLGVWRHLLPVPAHIWKSQVAHSAQHTAERLKFMTDQLRLVRNFVVRELPRYGKPMPPAWIAAQLGLPLDEVVAALDQLEKHKTFLFRDSAGEVVWAYPVTVEPTPHRLTFSSGEKLYAA